MGMPRNRRMEKRPIEWGRKKRKSSHQWYVPCERWKRRINVLYVPFDHMVSVEWKWRNEMDVHFTCVRWKSSYARTVWEEWWVCVCVCTVWIYHLTNLFIFISCAHISFLAKNRTENSTHVHSHTHTHTYAQARTYTPHCYYIDGRFLFYLFHSRSSHKAISVKCECKVTKGMKLKLQHTGK